MGAIYGGTCYGSDLAAAQAFCGATYPRTTVEAGAPTSWTCTPAAGSITVAAFQSASSTPASSHTLATAFQPCDPAEHYTDLLGLWGIGLAALAAVYVLRRMIVEPLWSNQ